MLPVVAGPKETRRQILIYSILLVPLATAPYFVGLGGLTYLALSVVLGAVFLFLAARVYATTTEGREADAAARRLFLFSILYLYALFATLFVEALLHRLMA